MAGTSSGPRAMAAQRPGFHRALLEQSRNLVVVLDPAGRLLYVSPAMRAVLGRDPDAWLGRSIFDLLDPGDVSLYRARLESLVGEAPGTEVSAEVELQRSDGAWRTFEAFGKQLVDDPAIGGVLVQFSDVTRVRSLETARDRATEILHDLLRHGPFVAWMIDADGVFLLSEGRGLEALGLVPGEVVGRNAFEVYPDDREIRDILLAGLDGQEREIRTVLAGRIFEGHVRPIEEGGAVVGAVGVALDVTEWAQEGERAKLQARLLDHVGQAVVVFDEAGTVVYWNPAAEAIYGWDREEAIGASVVELTVPEAFRESAREILDRLRTGERFSGELQARRRDGGTFPTYVTSVPVIDDGELTAIIGIATDLTEQKELEGRLRQAQKMEAVGQLAGGIAHDFNNLLTTIGGYASLVAEQVADPNVASDVREVVGATRRARALAEKLLAFSGREAGRLESVNLNTTVEGLAARLKRLLGDQIRLVLETDPRPWLARTEPGVTEQAIINLVLNARDAMPTGGTLTLATDRVRLDAKRARSLDAGLSPGEYMRLVVQDTGGGVAPAIRERIFEPFFTTKAVGKGRGLGLSIAFGAVKRSGGGITVESEPGAGSRFALYFPRAFEPLAPAREGTGVARPSRPGPVTVLVVEDELAVRGLARRVLAREGFDVLEAGTGQEAWQLLRERAEPVDLIVTDVIMPEMSGPELIQRLREHSPELRSLFISGYTADELESRGLSRGEENFLAKPFTPADLLGAVTSVLED